MSNIPAPNLSVMANCSSSVTEKHATPKAQKCDKAIIFYPLWTHGLNKVNFGGEVTDITTDPEDKYPLTVKTPEVTEEQPAKTYTVNGEKFDSQKANLRLKQAPTRKAMQMPSSKTALLL